MPIEIVTENGGNYIVSDEAVKATLEKEKWSIPDMFLDLPVIPAEQRKRKKKNPWLDGLKSRLAKG